MLNDLHNLRDYYLSFDLWINSWLKCKLCGTHLLCSAHTEWLKRDLKLNRIKKFQEGGEIKCSAC